MASVYGNEEYTVAWICALHIEQKAARLMLDREHGRPQWTHNSDENTYILGESHEHMVVIAALPSGEMGTNSAATVAAHLPFSFSNIRFGLLVGVGGGVPGPKADIRLGDVVVANPEGTEGGVIQYDRGKSNGFSGFERVGSLLSAAPILRSAVSNVRSGSKAEELFDSVVQPRLWSRKLSKKDARLFRHQADDVLFRTEYDHVNPENRCHDVCDPSEIVSRDEREDGARNPVVHYGTIASGNLVIKNATMREQIMNDTNALCVEMEAAGLLHRHPYLVIRGICDYSDTHKNKDWQPYAAITAAAFATEILSVIPPSQRIESLRLKSSDKNMNSEIAGLRDGSHRLRTQLVPSHSSPPSDLAMIRSATISPRPQTVAAHPEESTIRSYASSPYQDTNISPDSEKYPSRLVMATEPEGLGPATRASPLGSSSPHHQLESTSTGNEGQEQNFFSPGRGPVVKDLPKDSVSESGFQAFDGSVSERVIAIETSPNHLESVSAQEGSDFATKGKGKAAAVEIVAFDPISKKRIVYSPDVVPNSDNRASDTAPKKPITGKPSPNQSSAALDASGDHDRHWCNWSAISPHANAEYHIAWYCEQLFDREAAVLMLDKVHGRPQTTRPRDSRSYLLGEVHGHLVVLVLTDTELDLEDKKRTFPNIRLTFSLGLAGGLPGFYPGEDSIRLGDVVVTDGCQYYTFEQLDISDLKCRNKSGLYCFRKTGSTSGRIEGDSKYRSGYDRDTFFKPKPALLDSVILPQVSRIITPFSSNSEKAGAQHHERLITHPGRSNDILQTTSWCRRDRRFSTLFRNTDGSVINVEDFDLPLEPGIVSRKPRLLFTNNPVTHRGILLLCDRSGFNNMMLPQTLIETFWNLNWEVVRQATGASCIDMLTAESQVSHFLQKRPGSECLFIRGIASYCDSPPPLNWNPLGDLRARDADDLSCSWYRYASLTAAAHARESLAGAKLLKPKGKLFGRFVDRQITPEEQQLARRIPQEPPAVADHMHLIRRTPPTSTSSEAQPEAASIRTQSTSPSIESTLIPDGILGAIMLNLPPGLFVPAVRTYLDVQIICGHYFRKRNVNQDSVQVDEDDRVRDSPRSNRELRLVTGSVDSVGSHAHINEL
ncbi:hypothetical protein BJ508DRAFT_419761 [Ascobolus immersus RN42]|uniref:Uncharacterized protein n=1 Tax=Ascobolus immersus RN42 TaxID=1160509 RepID=A0A3N4HF57_ASCIM|nr:hypothetical protein BJ508DRAFT_419761 [Ascobolus immersus RN42]